jgi:hypothetical protein
LFDVGSTIYRDSVFAQRTLDHDVFFIAVSIAPGFASLEAYLSAAMIALGFIYTFAG